MGKKGKGGGGNQQKSIFGLKAEAPLDLDSKAPIGQTSLKAICTGVALVASGVLMPAVSKWLSARFPKFFDVITHGGGDGGDEGGGDLPDSWDQMPTQGKLGWCRKHGFPAGWDEERVLALDSDDGAE